MGVKPGSGSFFARAWQPVLQGFNYKGGLNLPPELVAVAFGLIWYTGTFIAEIVRAGILSVNKGQTEAAQVERQDELRHPVHRKAADGVTQQQMPERPFLPEGLEDHLERRRLDRAAIKAAFWIGAQIVWPIFRPR